MFAANTSSEKLIQRGAVGMDIGKAATTSKLDGKQYAVDVNSVGWRVS